MSPIESQADPQTLWQDWFAQQAAASSGLSQAHLDAFQKLYDLLIEANRSVNLTRITDLPDFLTRHLSESLVLSPHIPQNARVADIGTGAGFPLFPLAITRSDLSLTAVESVGKKCRFIETTAAALTLPNITVLAARAEDLAHQPKHRESFDIVTARAVAALPTLLEITIPLLKPGGKLLAIKGNRYQSELEASEDALDTLNASLVSIEPASDHSDGALLVIEKTASTPAIYPRKAGLPQKKPL